MKPKYEPDLLEPGEEGSAPPAGRQPAGVGQPDPPLPRRRAEGGRAAVPKGFELARQIRFILRLPD